MSQPAHFHTMPHIPQLLDARQAENLGLLYYQEEAGWLEFTWQEIRQQVLSFQSYLVEQGLEEGAPLLCLLPDIPEAVYAFLAAHSLGCVYRKWPKEGWESPIQEVASKPPKLILAGEGILSDETLEKSPSKTGVVWVPTTIPPAMGQHAKFGIYWNETFFADAQWKAVAPDATGILLETKGADSAYTAFTALALWSALPSTEAEALWAGGAGSLSWVRAVLQWIRSGSIFICGTIPPKAFPGLAELLAARFHQPAIHLIIEAPLEEIPEVFSKFPKEISTQPIIDTAGQDHQLVNALVKISSTN